MPETNRVTFFALSADPERLHLLGTLALTAAAVGDEVSVLFAGAALKKWQGGPRSLDQDAPDGSALGLPSPSDALQQARSLGARIVACETFARLAGIEPADVAATVDEVVPLAGFWIGARGGRVVVL
jgi:peroxiredoxin family protein